MVRPHYLSMTGAIIVCLVTIQGSGTLSASQDERALTGATASQPPANNALEAAMSTPGGPPPAIPLDEQASGADVSSAPAPATEPARFSFDTGVLRTNPSLGPITQAAHRTINLAPAQSDAFAAQVYQGRPYRMGRDGSIAAIMIGAVASIAGAAVLVYANRPECETRQFMGGCGYGTKVVGGAVLSGGIAALFVGALTWR
jgi:hypothetical protein